MASTPPQTYQIPGIDPGTAAWEAAMTTNFLRLTEAARTFSITHTGPGPTPGAGAVGVQQAISIQLLGLNGSALALPESAKTTILRVRLCQGDDGYLLANNATINTPIVLGTVLEDLGDANHLPAAAVKVGRDLVIRTNSSGLAQLLINSPSIESYTIRVGPPPVGARLGSYDGSRVLTIS